MMRRSLWLVSVLVFVLACLGVSQASADDATADIPAADVATVESASPGLSAPEADFLGRINQLRSSVGAGPLAVDPALTEVARQWANTMAASGNLVHNPQLRNQAPPGYSLVGENIGWGSDVNIIDLYLRNSPLHFQNMVNPAFDKIGIGVVELGGRLFVVQDYTAN